MNFYTNVLQRGNNLHVRAVVNGERQNFKIRYQPTLFSPVNQETGYKTLEGVSVLPRHFDTMKEAKEWASSYESQPELVYGNTQFSYNYISDTYSGQVDWDLEKILVVTIDIEVECENGFPSANLAEEPMLSITVKNHQNKKIVVFGLHEFHTDRDDVTYVQCESEVHLLKEFLVFWEKHQPDIITGWNTEFFDIPYLCNRITKLFGEDELKRLSPWGVVYSKEIYKMGSHHQETDVSVHPHQTVL
jgi:DNA polymerase elongation subunit (family B)